MTTTLSIRVRPGRESDAMLLRAIRLEALADSPDAFGEIYDECAAWNDDVWASKARKWNFYLAEMDGEVVGMARGEAHQDEPDVRYLFAMYVSPAARGTGVATLLLDTVSAWAAAEGVDVLYLYVSVRALRARAFYSKLGFVESGESVTMDRDVSLVCDEMRRDVSDFAFHARRVEASELYDLRLRILREGQTGVDVANVGDALATSLHYGGFLGERVVVSASLFVAASPWSPHESSYQLRYMATDFDVQGRGLARRLMNQVIDDLARRGVHEIWANARTSALNFYSAFGCEIIKDSLFISAETGIEHVVIRLAVV
ncbi:MAG TPA: GNAT family N-acetyltransferase [Acidimicrobiales bacterium]